ncbi:dUTP diphosphatase [Candidatus Nanopelagicales bacterium]|nr:dUTP diphosphatase [Candidatus Nanopelagicales bacterium]
MTNVDVLVHRLDPDLPLPVQQHPGDAGFDLQTRIDVVLEPGARTLLPTGLALALPDGFVGFVVPRSGLAVKHGVSIVNAPGTIDAGYRGEIKVSLVNLAPDTAVVLQRGDRIAQLVVQQIPRVRWHEVATLPGSERDRGGFGSTGSSGMTATDSELRPDLTAKETK